MFILLTSRTGNIYKYTFSPLIFIVSLSLSLSLSLSQSIGNLQKYPISPFFHSPLPLRPPPTIINLKTRQPQSSIHPYHTKHSNPNPPYQKTTT
ncbi:hypothetical protein QC762_201975 [Podospora pseudocomata]|uniref:Uncharacterized protein n=1 Tax=Podospora pseudocomata TaxID=2093779 RepID=A0ABR0GQ51_9PEZI|nr:hypothetical protein QC762_201975 [Podospora pseudocomata]